MQALEFTRALKEITDELKVPDLLTILQPWISAPNNQPIPDQTKDQLARLILNSNAAYERLARSPDTREILTQLDIGALYEPGRVRGVLGSLSSVPTSTQLVARPDLFSQFYSLTEQLRSLMRVESAARLLLEEAKLQGISSNDRILELELIEYSDEVGITPKRLDIFVSSITKLHMVLGLLLELKQDTLTFKYFDSGSGVLIGIAAGAPIIAALGALLNQWWDKIRFYRYDTYEKKVEAVSKTLDIVDVIEKKIKDGAITREVGENLKVRMFREVETLTEIGAMVPLRDATIDQQQLLTEIRNTKLLSSGSNEVRDAQQPDISIPPNS